MPWKGSYETGIVNYEKRKRDYRIETDRELAIDLLRVIYQELVRPTASWCWRPRITATRKKVADSEQLHRELAYNLEHTNSSYGPDRVGINEVSSLVLPRNWRWPTHFKNTVSNAQ